MLYVNFRKCMNDRLIVRLRASVPPKTPRTRYNACFNLYDSPLMFILDPFTRAHDDLKSLLIPGLV